MVQRAASDLKAFGKLPFSAEFVRLGLDSELTFRFAEWLDEGMGCCNASSSVRWFEDPRTRDGVSFIWPSEDAGSNALLVGGMAPSEDRFGRRFPFAAMTEMALHGGVGPAATLPLGAGRFLGQCALTRQATSAGSLPEVLAGIAIPHDGELTEGAELVREGFGAEEQLAPLIEDIFEEFTDASPAANACIAMRFFVEAVFAAMARRTAPRSIRLPIGARSGNFPVAMWLTIARRVGGRGMRMPSVFWSAAATPGSALFHFGPVTPATFARIWGDIPGDAGLVDLVGRRGGNLWNLPQVPAAVTAALHDPTASVDTLLSALDRIVAWG